MERTRLARGSPRPFRRRKERRMADDGSILLTGAAGQLLSGQTAQISRWSSFTIESAFPRDRPFHLTRAASR